tara:strand:+ start:2584 stop:4011 length:1428 start_codon:yes stop_codon:yes gene_type:complete
MYEFIRLIYKYIDKIMYLKKNQLLPIFKLSQKKSEIEDCPILFTFTQKIELNCDINKLLDLELKELNGKSYWGQLSEKNYFFSLGEIYSINSDIIKSKSKLNMNIEKIIKETISYNETPQEEIPIFIGGQNFNLNDKNSNIWDGISSSNYRIPKILIKKNKNLTTITFFSLIDNKTCLTKLYSKYSVYYRIIKEYKNQRKQNQIKLESKKIRLSKNIFANNVTKVKSMIDNQNISKAVLSNICEYSFKGDITYSSFIESLEKKYPECAVFYYNYNGVFLGASPEKILSSNQNSLLIDALAGSINRDKNPQKDIENQQELLKDKKIIHEHDIVVKGILESLSKININANPGSKHILKLKNIYHLKTCIKAEKNSENIMDILDSIAPTPALSGYPKEEAIKIIENLEDYDRGWYCGAIGWINSNLNANFYAGLRSAYIKNNYIYIYAGAGITKDSIIENEWNEIINKMSAIDEIVNE